MAPARRPCPPAPDPLEDYAARFDDLWCSLAQRRGFREYLAGPLLPRDHSKTPTTLADAEPVVGAQNAAVQRVSRTVGQIESALAGALERARVRGDIAADKKPREPAQFLKGLPVMGRARADRVFLDNAVEVAWARSTDFCHPNQETIIQQRGVVVDLELQGKVAVVTGASKGIGLATVAALLDEGAHVVASSRTNTSEDE